MRIYATADGGSRVEELTISPNAKPVDITRMTASVFRRSGAAPPDWHTAPRRQFEINVTRALGPITNVFLHVPENFDVVAWAAGR